MTFKLPEGKISQIEKAKRARTFQALLFSLALVCALCLQQFFVAAQASGKSDFDGYILKQRNHILGLMSLELCPAGMIFRTQVADGFIDVRTKPIMVTLFNDEKKRYKKLLLEDFRKRMTSFGKPMLDAGAADWYYLVKNRCPGKVLFKFKTTEVDYVFKHKSPPMVEFPDQMFISTDIPCPKAAMSFFASVFKLPIPKDIIGVPLLCVETMHLNPTKTILGHETLSSTAKTFSDKDFSVPANYKKSDSDADVYNFGLSDVF